MSTYRIGILEFGYRHGGQSSMHALMDVNDLCRRADELGFHYYWLTEHHVNRVLSAWSCPRLLLPLLLQQTDRIRIGMAGVLSNFHAPYRVALDFKLLANLFPNRVDLGFANGRPSLRVASALRTEELRAYPDDFNARVADTLRYLRKEQWVMEKDRIILPPAFGALPECYQLGSSLRDWRRAVDNECHLVKSTFHSVDALEGDEKEDAGRYRDAFQAAHGYAPRVMMALALSCVPTAAERADVYRSMTDMQGGGATVNHFIGTPDATATYLADLQRRYGVTDFIIRPVSGHHEHHLRTLQLLADHGLLRGAHTKKTLTHV